MDSKINKSKLAKVMQDMQQRQINQLYDNMRANQTLGTFNNYRRTRLRDQNHINGNR